MHDDDWIFGDPNPVVQMESLEGAFMTTVPVPNVPAVHAGGLASMRADYDESMFRDPDRVVQMEFAGGRVEDCRTSPEYPCYIRR